MAPAAPAAPDVPDVPDAAARLAAAEKRLAAEAAAALVEPGMLIGLGTGSTVAYLFEPLARRAPGVLCVATSAATAAAAAAAGLDVRPFDGIERLDLAIDGADQVSDAGWLVKGGGGAHTREKIVAAAARRFAVIVSSDKIVATLRPPVPLELEVFGVDATLRAVGELGEVRRRTAPPSPDGGVLADLWVTPDDPAALARRLDAVPGVRSHGLFPPSLVAEVLVGVDGRVERRPATLPG